MDDLQRRFPGVDFETMIEQTPPVSPEDAAHTMRALGYDTDTVGTVCEVESEPDDIALWAQALEPSMFTDVCAIETHLSDTMEPLRHPTAWLGADDPMTFRADMSELADRQFRAWLDAVR